MVITFVSLEHVATPAIFAFLKVHVYHMVCLEPPHNGILNVIHEIQPRPCYTGVKSAGEYHLVYFQIRIHTCIYI